MRLRPSPAPGCMSFLKIKIRAGPNNGFGHSFVAINGGSMERCLKLTYQYIRNLEARPKLNTGPRGIIRAQDERRV